MLLLEVNVGMRSVTDRHDIAANLLEYGLEVDLLVWVVWELDVEHGVQLARGDPRHGAGMARGILGVFDG